MRWAEYAAASRRLAEIRGQEAARQSHAEQRAAAGRASVEQLGRRLAAQHDHLAGVAMRLREPRPRLDGAARSGQMDLDGAARNGPTDLDEAIRRAAQAIDEADAEARRAEERGTRPVLLPTMSANGRNAVIYAVAAVVMWLVSLGWYAFGSRTGSTSIGLLLWSAFGLPAVALFGGHLVISIAGRPRVRPSGQVDRSIRLGGLICFGGMALGWTLLRTATALL